MPIDARIPLMGQSFDLAGIMKQAQDRRLNEQDARMREEKFAFQKEQIAREQEAAEKEQKRAQAMTIARLTSGINDEATYQQRLAAAQQMGLDMSGAPRYFDPEWVQTQNVIATFAAERPEALSTFGKIAADEGHPPGSPQYNARVTQLVKADAMKTLSFGPGGGVASFNTIDGTTTPVVEPYQGSDIPVVNSPDEARRLPPGTQFRMPDGRIGTVPGGGSGNATGGF